MMASQFCMKCGQPLPAGAQFCLSCGNPVAGAPPAAPPGTVPSPAGAAGAAPPPGGDLSTSLGLKGLKNFLVQHQMLSMGHSYRVLDSNKRHLFTVQGNTNQNLQGNAMENLLGGGYLGRLAGRSVNMTYNLTDSHGTLFGTIAKEGGGNSSTFTLTDAAGQRAATIHLQRSLVGGITATAVDGAGHPLLQTSGNLMRHNFMIKGASGHELAKVHEAWVAVRDTYNLDVMGDIDPVYPLVFAVMIDFEKEK